MNTTCYGSEVETAAAKGPWIELLQQGVRQSTADRARARQLLSEPDGLSRELLWYLGCTVVSFAFIAGLLIGLAAGL
jgi:hypothetical protein